MKRLPSDSRLAKHILVLMYSPEDTNITMVRKFAGNFE